MSTICKITYFKGKEFRWGERTYIMGIVNVTPDSFSGDGLGNDSGLILAQVKRFITDGVDIIDIGGESTRPESTPITATEELKRVIPVIEMISREVSVPLSIDTYRAEVAEKAILAGASMINDVWGLKKDANIASIAAQYGVPIVITQNQRADSYNDFFPELIASIKGSIDLALSSGVKPENIILDPGVGFGKTVAQNLEIIRRLGELKLLGMPILLGTSRKSVIGHVLNLPVDQRLEGTAATVAIGIANGADIVRVHDVAQMVRVARMSDAVIRAGFTSAAG